MARRREKGNNTTIIAAALILIIVAASWGYLMLLEEPLETFEETQDLSEEPSSAGSGMAGELLEYSREGWSKSAINEVIGDRYELVIGDKDITADGRTEFVVIEQGRDHPSPHRSLRRVGYEQVVEGMVIYRRTGGSLVPAFVLTSDTMRDERGTQLIGQVHAGHGYALLVYDHEDEDVYPVSVKMFDLVLLDEQGRASSDDITIYWDPATGLYRATNTFGAPGTYSDEIGY